MFNKCGFHQLAYEIALDSAHPIVLQLVFLNWRGQHIHMSTTSKPQNTKLQSWPCSVCTVQDVGCICRISSDGMQVTRHNEAGCFSAPFFYFFRNVPRAFEERPQTQKLLQNVTKMNGWMKLSNERGVHGE